MSAAPSFLASPRRLAIALLVTLLLLTGLTWFALVAPKHAQATKLASQIQAAQNRLQLAAHHRRTVVAQHRKLVALSTRRAIPDDVSMPQIVMQLNRLATESDVTLDTITPQTTTPAPTYGVIPINIVLTGHFFAVQRFLYELRNQVKTTGGEVRATGRLYDVQSVELVPATQPPNLTATITLNAFALAGAAPPAPPTTTTTTTPATPS